MIFFGQIEIRVLHLKLTFANILSCSKVWEGGILDDRDISERMEATSGIDFIMSSPTSTPPPLISHTTVLV